MLDNLGVAQDTKEVNLLTALLEKTKCDTSSLQGLELSFSMEFATTTNNLPYKVVDSALKSALKAHVAPRSVGLNMEIMGLVSLVSDFKQDFLITRSPLDVLDDRSGSERIDYFSITSRPSDINRFTQSVIKITDFLMEDRFESVDEADMAIKVDVCAPNAVIDPLALAILSSDIAWCDSSRLDDLGEPDDWHATFFKEALIRQVLTNTSGFDIATATKTEWLEFLHAQAQDCSCDLRGLTTEIVSNGTSAVFRHLGGAYYFDDFVPLLDTAKSMALTTKKATRDLDFPIHKFWDQPELSLALDDFIGLIKEIHADAQRVTIVPTTSTYAWTKEDILLDGYQIGSVNPLAPGTQDVPKTASLVSVDGTTEISNSAKDTPIIAMLLSYKTRRVF